MRVEEEEASYSHPLLMPAFSSPSLLEKDLNLQRPPDPVPGPVGR